MSDVMQEAPRGLRTSAPLLTYLVSLYLANCDGLSVEPDVLPSRAVKDAVRVDHLVLDPGSKAIAAIGVEDDRPDGLRHNREA